MDFESETFIAEPVAFDTTQLTHLENRQNPQPGAPCHSLAAGGHVPAIAFSGRARGDDGRGYSRAPHVTGEITGALETVKPWNVATGAAVRRLMPVECERLQGLPDGYTLTDYKRKPMSDGPRYRMIGNAWPKDPVEWIGRRIERSLQCQKPVNYADAN